MPSPRASSHVAIVVAALIVAACDSGPARLYPGTPRIFKIDSHAFRFTLGDHWIDQGVEILFAPPLGYRAYYAGRVDWYPRPSPGDRSITIMAGLPLEVLKHPCHPFRETPGDLGEGLPELRRNPVARGVSATCDLGHDRLTVVVVRELGNWAVRCSMSFHPDQILEKDALAVCNTMHLLRVSEFTKADADYAFRNFGDGP